MILSGCLFALLFTCSSFEKITDMKKFLFIAIVLTCFSTHQIVAQVNMPAPSPTQTIRQEFGMGRIELTYSRPSVKGRKLFKDNSELAPLGKLWRTGANAATKIKFTDKVMMGGKSIDTGTYVLYTIPNKNDWEIILNKGLTNWGVDGYKESEDVVRFKVPSHSVKPAAETFTMQIANINPESAALHIMWGGTGVNVPITTNVKDRLRTQIENALKADKKPMPYQQAANFYYEWDKDYAKALEYVNKGISDSPKAFWLYLLKARIQKDMGDKAGAKASANKTIEIATEAKNDDYVRMANDILKKV
jgi:tetratricopeptide (TPR) repeat protein